MKPSELGTLNVGDPQIVRDLAHHNQVSLTETDDGWLNARLDGTVYKAPTQTAAA
jgi:hypothetical protein